MIHDSTSHGPAFSSSRLNAGQWAILFVVLVADILDLMDSTITNIAAPSIVKDIGGDQSLIKWLGAGYALAMGALLVLGGRLGDRFGKRRIFLIGLAGFTLASLSCGVSVNPLMIIVSRIAQGGFGALLLPQGLSILMASFSREQFPTAVSAFGPTLGISAIVGPLVAGFLISANLGDLHWRPVFLINIVLGIVCFIVAVRLLPKDKSNPSEQLDSVGSILLGVSMLFMFYGFIQGPTDGWTLVPISSVLIGLVVLVGFGFRQVLATDPLIKPSLFKNRGFNSGLLMGLGFFASVNGFSYVISLFMQLVLGMRPSESALGMIPLLLGVIVSSTLGRPLIEKWGRKLVLVGLIVSFAGALTLELTIFIMADHINAVGMAPALLILGIGMGACFGSIFDVAIGDVAPAEAGSASGALSAVQQFANASGSALVTSIFFAELSARGGYSALQLTVAVVGGLVVLCLALVPLLPRQAGQQPS